jgi:6-phosphogluconolactonase
VIVSGQVEILPDRSALWQAAADAIAAIIRETLDRSDCCAVALSGGTTPQEVYRTLARRARASEVQWPRVHLFWGDERCVPPNHSDSNYAMVKKALLDHISIPEENVHRIAGEWAPEKAARRYDRELRDFFREAPDSPVSSPPKGSRRFDLILLGLGEDGHTASLFPRSQALEEERHWAVAVEAPAPGSGRVTLTLPVINSAAEVLFLVSGSNKAAVLRAVLEPEGSEEELPAQRVRPEQGRLRWMVDAEAAARLHVR